MQQIFNELGISLVLGKGNWIGLSYEVEEGENEIRGIGWKKIKLSEVKDIYFRVWFFKKSFSLGKKVGFQYKNRNKYAFKIILGFSN